MKTTFYTKNMGRVSYDKVHRLVDKDTGETVVCMDNIKSEHFWLVDLPQECLDYIFGLCGIDYSFKYGKPLFRMNTVVSEWRIISRVLLEMQENNLLKTQENATMLNGHTEMNETPQMKLSINTNSGENDMKNYYGIDTWEDFIASENRRKSDCYLKMNNRDNTALLIKFIKFYINRFCMMSDYNRFLSDFNSVDDTGFKYEDISVFHHRDCLKNHYEYKWDEDNFETLKPFITKQVLKYGNILNCVEGKKSIEEFCNIAKTILNRGFVKPDSHGNDSKFNKYWMLGDKYKNKTNEYYGIGIHKDWPCLALEPSDIKDKKGHRKVKLPIISTTGWGWHKLKKEGSEYDIFLPDGNTSVKSILNNSC